MNKKILSIFILTLFASLAAFAVHSLSAKNSPDAIAIRIMSNPRHMSPMRWYRDQGFIGSPQAITVDGYDAIRDANTVYVNTAHVIDTTDPATLYTNIFVLTSSVGSDAQTLEIFNRILANFKFNTNLTDTDTDVDICKSSVNDTLTATSTKCYNTPECGAGEFCTGTKGKTVRDVRRLEDLEYMNSVLDEYRKTHNNRCPEIKSGTYVPNRSVSTWNSWQDELGAVIGARLPYDPINQLGRCASTDTDNKKYDAKTCWDTIGKKFSTTTSKNILNMNLPTNSRAYTYSVSEDGLKCGFFTNSETGVMCGAQGRCGVEINTSDSQALAVPEITCGNILGKTGKPLDGTNGTSNAIVVKSFGGAQITAMPTLAKLGTLWPNWAGGPVIKPSGGSLTAKTYRIYADRAGDQYSGSTLIDYQFRITATDTRGKTATKDCRIVVGGFCGDGIMSANLNEECDWYDFAKPTPTRSSSTNTYACGNNSKTDITNPAIKLACKWLNTANGGGYCGDNIVQTSHNEKCEPTGYVSPVPADSSAAKGYVCGVSGSADACNFAIGVSGGYCGDGVVQNSVLSNGYNPHEECDKGVQNGAAGSNCSATCLACDDADADGYGAAGQHNGIINGCKYNGADCDDNPATHTVGGTKGDFVTTGDKINPAQPDNCTQYDGLDNNCNGQTDEHAGISTVIGTNVQDFEDAALGSWSPGWSGGGQQHSSVAISSADNHTLGGSKSILLHQDANVNINWTCNKANCTNSEVAVNTGCIWNDAAKTCTYSWGDACHAVGPVVYNDGEGQCWGRLNTVDWGYFVYNLSTFPFDVNSTYILNYYYKGRSESTYMHSSLSYHPGWSTQAYGNYAGIICKGGYLGYSITSPAICNSYTGGVAAFDMTQCNCVLHATSLAQQTNSYPSLGMAGLPGGVYDDWSFFSSNFNWTADMETVKDDSGLRQTLFGASFGYNDTADATDLYIDDLNLLKCSNL